MRWIGVNKQSAKESHRINPKRAKRKYGEVSKLLCNSDIGARNINRSRTHSLSLSRSGVHYNQSFSISSCADWHIFYSVCIFVSVELQNYKCLWENGRYIFETFFWNALSNQSQQQINKACARVNSVCAINRAIFGRWIWLRNDDQPPP